MLGLGLVLVVGFKVLGLGLGSELYYKRLEYETVRTNKIGYEMYGSRRHVVGSTYDKLED